MKIRNTAAFVALVALVATGCGDFPDGAEHATGSAGTVNFESQSLGVSERLAAEDLLIGGTDEERRIDRYYPELVEEEEGAELPLEAWDDTANEPVVVPIFTEVDEENAADEPAPMPAGFADGCASQDEWNGLANAICETYDASIAQVTLGDSCGQGQYRVSNFGCMISGDDKSETTYREFTSVLLGDETTCKTIASMRLTADAICGTTATIVELKGLAECDADIESDETYFQAARVTCTDLD